MFQRKYGNTDIMLSVVGFGGIVVRDEEPETAGRLVSQAVERGVNYFDVAPSYGDSEERLGPALEPYRESVFLACKTGQRDAEGAQKELRQSLSNLRTDHFDLYQFHSVSKIEDVEKIFSPGGAMETVLKARSEGIIRYVGFSSHQEKAAVLMMDRFEFDSVLFPINWAAWLKDGLGAGVIEEARKKGAAILALKSLAKRKWRENEDRKWSKTWYSPVDTPEEASLAIRFTLSKPVTAAVSPGHAELLWWACDAADSFKPLTEEEERLLVEKSRDIDPIFSM